MSFGFTHHVLGKEWGQRAPRFSWNRWDRMQKGFGRNVLGEARRTGGTSLGRELLSCEKASELGWCCVPWLLFVWSFSFQTDSTLVLR